MTTALFIIIDIVIKISYTFIENGFVKNETIMEVIWQVLERLLK